MGLLISLFFIVLTCVLYLALAIFAFPEIAVFLLIFFHGLFDPKQYEPFYFGAFERLYPIYLDVYERFSGVETYLKWIIIIGVPTIYIVFNSVVHIKKFYPIKLLGVCLSIWAVYTFCNNELNANNFWTIAATIIGAILAIGARMKIHNYVEVSLAIISSYLRKSIPKKEKESKKSYYSKEEEIYVEELRDEMDYYRFVLGVSESASKDEIMRAYRSLVMKYHPDKNPDKSSEEKYREVVEAYNNLMT